MGTIICCFITFLLEAIIIRQYASRLFAAKYSFRRRTLVLSILYSALFLFFLLENLLLNAFLTLLVNFIYFFTQYKIRWYTAVLHAFIIVGIITVNELIAYNLISYFSFDFFIEPYFLHIIFSKTLSYMVLSVLVYLLKGQQELDQPLGRKGVLLGLLPLTSLFVVITFIAIDKAAPTPSSLQWMVAVCAALMLLTNFLVFGLYWYEQKKAMEFSEMKLMLQKEADSVEYYKMLSSQNENQSILIHDMKRHLQSISLLNDKQEFEKIDAYIKQLVNSSDLTGSSRLCDNEMLNAILLRYRQQCKERAIAFHADIRSGSTHFISDTDLTALFCNLLDNAVEAAAGIPEAYIEICAEKRENTPLVVITVVNSCLTNPFSQNMELITNKSDRQQHGLGIKSIRKTLRQYEGDMQMHYDDDTMTFHTIVTLKQ